MVQYKKGKDNLVVDALSRKVDPKADLAAARPFGLADTTHLPYENELDSHGGVLCMISFPSPSWLSDLKTSYVTDQQVQGILLALSSGQAAPKGYSLQNGLLLYKGRIYLGTCEALKVAILH